MKLTVRKYYKMEMYQLMPLRAACGVKTKARQVGSASPQTMQRKHFLMLVPGTTGQMEIDNQADTTVFGATMTAIAFIGQACDVQLFKETMPPERDVPKVSASMTHDDPDQGKTIILGNTVNQGLWFGNTMQHSLVNPNQCRIIGINLCDNPFDKYQKFGINNNSIGLAVPLEFSHCAVGETINEKESAMYNDRLRRIMTRIGDVYDLKDSVKRPDQNLGANIERRQPDGGRIILAMSGREYV